MTKKKRKSLVGWTVEHWDLAKVVPIGWPKSASQIEHSYIFGNKNSVIGGKPVKVKMIMEEI